jgi:hypothetical protein
VSSFRQSTTGRSNLSCIAIATIGDMRTANDKYEIIEALALYVRALEETQMTDRLKVVTGAASRIGRSIAPYFHRNVSSELVGALSEGARAAENFPVGSAELTNMLTPHGQAVSVWEHASHSDLAPERLDGLLFMWETQLPITLTSQAAQAARVVSNGYDEESGKNTYQRHFSP